MRTGAAAGAGFLFAVLWFDLMFDVQAHGYSGQDLPRPVRASIAAYYARVTTSARPMNRLVVVVMAATIGALIGELVREELPLWRAAASLGLMTVAVGLAVMRTVGNAVRLGRQSDDDAAQSALARSLLHDHLVCAACVGVVLALQLVPA
jgi:hypothetical protein